MPRMFYFTAPYTLIWIPCASDLNTYFLDQSAYFMLLRTNRKFLHINIINFRNILFFYDINKTYKIFIKHHIYLSLIQYIIQYNKSIWNKHEYKFILYYGHWLFYVFKKKFNFFLKIKKKYLLITFIYFDTK